MHRFHWWNSPGFRDDDGSIQWRDVARHFKSQWHIFVMRLDNRWQDARAVMAGACNASLWTGVPPNGYAGGYSHWRCGKAHGHTDMPHRMNRVHRFGNYTWTGEPHDRPMYDPLPIRNKDNTGWFDVWTVLPFRTLSEGRRPVERRSRARLRARWAEVERAPIDRD